MAKEASAGTPAPPRIFPIHLGSETAYHLVHEHAQEEWEEKTSWGNETYTHYYYHGELLENGDVEIRVGYNSDNGYMKSGGMLFSKTIRPYSQDQIEKLKDQRMTDLAKDIFYKRREAQERAEIEKLKSELFGPQ